MCDAFAWPRGRLILLHLRDTVEPYDDSIKSITALVALKYGYHAFIHNCRLAPVSPSKVSDLEVLDEWCCILSLPSGGEDS